MLPKRNNPLAACRHCLSCIFDAPELMASLNKLIASKGFLCNSLNKNLLPVTIEAFISKTSLFVTKQPLLGLDLGRQKCGIAISDDTHTLSIPLKIVSTKYLSSYLEYIHKHTGIFGLIVGIPLTLSGTLGSSASNACLIIDQISDFINSNELHVWFHDERYTTELSHSLYGPGKRVNLVDDLCAMKILQEHLDLRLQVQHHNQGKCH